MPQRPPHPCGKALCPALVQGRFCTPHQEEWDKRHRKERGTPAQRGYGAPWRAYSEAYRRKHPWCRICAKEGRRTPTEQVDHVKPVTGPGDPLFWDPRNHQPACRSCHSRKTVTEDKRGIGRREPA